MSVYPLQGAAEPVAEWTIDRDRIDHSLTGRRGDPAAGRALIADRRVAVCVLCHVVPGAAEAEMGNLGPSLEGVGGRRSAGQLRLRLVGRRGSAPKWRYRLFFARTSTTSRQPTAAGPC